MPITYAQATKLPYLNACITEGMRLHPSVGLPLQGYIPPGGATIAGVYLPEGYRVGINAAVVHYDKDVFGSDAEQFNPDRWIDGDAVQMDKAMIPFGAGSRTCIGKNVSINLPGWCDCFVFYFLVLLFTISKSMLQCREASIQ